MYYILKERRIIKRFAEIPEGTPTKMDVIKKQ
jgi:hypothetical protein